LGGVESDELQGGNFVEDLVSRDFIYHFTCEFHL
jgi:hypothetical protein